MPTSRNEAEQIVNICLEYMDCITMQKLFHKLNKEVGQTTTNDSLSKSLAMLDQLGDATQMCDAINETFADLNSLMDEEIT